MLFKEFDVERSWARMAEEIRAEAEGLPPGRAKDGLLKRARQLETASHLKEWAFSPELKPPV